jgi:hypothetical protein
MIPMRKNNSKNSFHLADFGQAKAKLQRAKIAARDLQTLKGAATLVTRTLGEIKDLKSDIERLERELQSTGSLKTVEDVQQEVDQASNDMCVGFPSYLHPRLRSGSPLV